jgi:hypothetical protein
MRRSIVTIVFAGACLSLGAAAGDEDGAEPALRREAREGLTRAVAYYRGHVARHGGYVAYTSEDLRRGWGEGEVGPETILVQPPGTPTVGEAYLKAFEATGDPAALDAARETALALVAGQLKSGGWAQVIHFAKPERGRMGAYRHREGGSWNVSSLDDDQTQSALRFLMRADRALGFRDKAIHEAARYGLNALLKAQFPNGGFAQAFSGPAENRPVLKASFPKGGWRTEGKIKEYWSQYTLNDNLVRTVSATLKVGHEIDPDAGCLAALRKLGDFLLLAQMPEPQPGWCQQYNAAMVPIWARKFEPPAIAGEESQGAMETLIDIARTTGDPKYLGPVPRALEYFRGNLLPGGRLARFTEFGTNRPLYMDARYQLTYDDSSAPSHYGWTQGARLDAIQKALDELKAGVSPAPSRPRRDRSKEVRRVLAELDATGRWVSTFDGENLLGKPKFSRGDRYLSSEVFARNVELLSDHLGSRAERGPGSSR